MKKNGFIFLIILLLLIVIPIPMIMATWHATESNMDGELLYYSATEVSSDGDKLTNSGVKKQLGIKNVSYIMSLILKDSGDCGIFMIDQGSLGNWEKNDEGISVNALSEELILKDRWGKLVYSTEYKGKDIKIVLERKEKLPACFSEHPEYTYGFEFNSQDTEALNSFMLDGNYCINGEILYGKFFDKKGESALGRCKIKSGKEPEIGELKILVSGGNAKFISNVKGYVYYLWASGGNESICRIPEEGGEPEVLREGECDYVQVRFGKIFFTDGKNRFCSMKKNGEDEHVIIDKAVFMPYVVDRNWVIYQDDADKEHLHIGTIDRKYDMPITEERSYIWEISGRDMYYTSTADKTDAVKHKCRLHKLNIDDFKQLTEKNTFETEKGEQYLGDIVAINKKNVFGGDGESVIRKKWKTLGNTLYKTLDNGHHILYLSDRYMICGSADIIGNFVEIELKDLKSGKSCSVMK